MALDKIIAIGLTLLAIGSLVVIRLFGGSKEQQNNQQPSAGKK